MEMTRPRARGALAALAFVLAAACGAPADSADETAHANNDVVRTGDPAVRGYTEDDFPRVQRLAEGVYTYEALRSAGAERFTTVSLFVVTGEGVLVADGQGNPDETQRMIDAIADITDQPITHVVVCSDHGDHTGGNSAFPEMATFIAHPTSAAVMAAGAARLSNSPGRIPTELVDDRMVLDLGGKEIHILFLGRAHTGGDLVVHLPEERILFMSEAYLNRIFPAMRSAYPSEWVAMIEKAQHMDVDTYIPGHGFVESAWVLREELEAYRQALLQVIEEGRRLHARGLDAEEAAEHARFGDLASWTLHSSQGATAIRRVYMELDGELMPAP